MQTLAVMAKQVLRWDRENLLNGAYRVSNVRICAESPPDLSGYTDCSTDEQFIDELSCAKQLLGITAAGLWLGSVLTDDRVQRVIAMLIEV